MKAKDLAFTVVVIVLIALTALTPNSPTLVLTRDVLADANPAPLAAPVGTSFTYQGQLMEDGEPADGVYDFQFMLYDEETAGSAVGSPVEVEDVVVTGGVFSTELDFGASAFAGEARFLEIGVRPGGSAGAYTTLDPRQKVTSTPYALYAAKAPWSGLSGVPAGFADGVDNGSAYQNVKIVAKSGGDFTTITAALNSITDASDSNRYLVWVAPGVYTEAVTMKPYVDIEGAGELTTRITFIGSAANTGTVVGANNAELRFLTAENTGGNTYATAIFSNGAAPNACHRQRFRRNDLHFWRVQLQFLLAYDDARHRKRHRGGNEQRWREQLPLLGDNSECHRHCLGRNEQLRRVQLHLLADDDGCHCQRLGGNGKLRHVQRGRILADHGERHCRRLGGNEPQLRRIQPCIRPKADEHHRHGLRGDVQLRRVQ
jgi:hypothetical protein